MLAEEQQHSYGTNLADRLITGQLVCGNIQERYTKHGKRKEEVKASSKQTSAVARESNETPLDPIFYNELLRYIIMENDSRNRKVNDNSLPVHLIGTSIQSKIIACKHTEKTWKSKNFNGCQSIIRGRKRGKGENASLMGVTNPVKERKKYLEKIKIINSFHSIYF